MMLKKIAKIKNFNNFMLLHFLLFNIEGYGELFSGITPIL
jgi:hypothetical protein